MILTCHRPLDPFRRRCFLMRMPPAFRPFWIHPRRGNLSRKARSACRLNTQQPRLKQNDRSTRLAQLHTRALLSTNSEGDVSSACASAYGSARSVHCDSCCSLWSSKGPELLHVFMLTLCGCQLCFTPTLASLCCCSLCLSLQALCFVCLCSCVRLRLQKLLCSSHRSHVFRFPSFNFHLCTVTPLARRTDGERDRTAREKARESDRTDSKDKSLEATRVTDAT